MKTFLRIASVSLAFALLLGSVICIAGDVTKITKDVYEYSDVPAPDGSIISEMNSFLPSAGLKVSDLSNHGGGQTRMVYTKSGVYYALFTGTDNTTTSGGEVPIGIDLIHIEDDGSARSVYHTEQPYTPSGPMVSVMADKEGTVWMYAGWQTGDTTSLPLRFMYNMWKYDPQTGTTTQYSENKDFRTKKVGSYRSGGYSACAIDEANRRIFAVVNCCDKPGYMEWSLFDMDTCTWSDPLAVKLDYRYCYTFILPDGKGGFHLFNMRDVVVESVKADNGKNVASAARNLHSSWYDNNMLFDEWDYFHLADPTVEEIETQFPVEPSHYEVEKGLYPEFGAPDADIFIDSKGYLHFTARATEQVEYGHRTMNITYDVSGDKPVELYHQNVEFAASSNEQYYCRYFEDTEGNLYLVCVQHCSLPMEFEIWGTSDPTKEMTLLYAELRDDASKQVAGTAMASSRNGSIMGDVMHWGIFTYESLWYDLTIDFAKLRAFLAR